MLLRVYLFALLVLAPFTVAKHHDDDKSSDHSSDHSHDAVTPLPASPPADDWRKYVPPEYQHYIPDQPVPDRTVKRSSDPNEAARQKYDPSYDQYGHKQVDHHKHNHDHDQDDKDHHKDDHDHDKKHDDDKHDKKHDKHDKHDKKHDKKDDKPDKHDDKKHHDKHDKHDNHDDKHHKSKHSKKHSKYSLADIDEINDEFDDDLFFTREADVDRVDDTETDTDIKDEQHRQSTWSWFGLIAVFLIGAVVALVALYWIAACVVAYLHRRRYSQLEQGKHGWADEEAMGLNHYTHA